MQKIRKAIIPAAGLGTRFLPATKAQPKEMLPIVDKPAIQFIIEEAIASGIEEILVITGRNKRSIEDHFDRSLELEMQLKAQGKYDLLGMIEEISNITIHFIRQKEAQGETLAQEGRAPDRMTRFFTGAPLAPRRPRRRVDTRRNLSPSEQEA